MFKIAVLVSGGGSNLNAIMESIEKGYIDCTIEKVISDREGTFAIERAKQRGINIFVVDRKHYGSNLSDEILKLIYGKVDLIVLAGFLSVLKGKIVEVFKNRIINVHPSLIPAFSGYGMHGIRVHEKAIEYGVKFSGCTVHFVDEGTDTGPIILQKVVPVYNNDNAEKLQRRILEKEHEAVCEAIKHIVEGKVRLKGRKVILESN